MQTMRHAWIRPEKAPSGGIILARLHPGDEVHTALRDLARRERLPSAVLSGIGAVNDVVLALFDPASRRYLETRLQEDLEVVSMSGNLSWVGEEPMTHLHGVVSRADCSTAAGHFVRATVSVTLEVTLVVGERRIERRPDPEFGLNLLDLG
jgi:uncharacterized protein